MVPQTSRAPLIWLLLPLLAGYFASSHLALPPSGWLAASGLLLAFFSWAMTTVQRRAGTLLWVATATASMAFLAAARHAETMLPPKGWEELPLREAVLEIKVQRVFQPGGEGRSIRGIALIRNADPHLRDLVGRRVAFSVWTGEQPEPLIRGSRASAAGVLQFMDATTVDPDGFHAFLLRSGIHHTFTRLALEPESLRTPWFHQFCHAGLNRLTDSFRRGSEGKEPSADVFTAMMLGQRAGLNPEQRLAFQRTGTLHLFAISGLHIGVVALTLHTLFLLFRFPPAAGAVAGLSILFLFVQITGASPSATRAFLMVAFFWGARLFKRQPNPVSALINSAFFILLLFPQQLWSPGFQLSYAVVAGILLLGLPMAERMRRGILPFRFIPEPMLHPIQRGWRDGLQWILLTACVSLSATLLSSPLSIHYFNVFAPGAVVLNMILVPLAGLVIVAGCASAASGFLLLHPLTTVFNHAAWAVIGCMVWLVEKAPVLPGMFWEAAFRVEGIGLAAGLSLVLCLLACSWRKWGRPWFHFSVPFLVLAFWLLFFARLTYPSPSG